MEDTIRVKLTYDGGPAHAARITDVNTGATIEGAFYVSFDANKSLPEAIIKVYQHRDGCKDYQCLCSLPASYEARFVLV